MRVVRKSDGAVILAKCELANSAWKRMIGLLLHKGLEDGEGLWITPTNSIHTMFMRFPMDAAFLDKKGEVVALYDSMKPWRFSWIHFRAKVVVEAAAGAFRKHGVKKGEVLELCPIL